MTAASVAQRLAARGFPAAHQGSARQPARMQVRDSIRTPIGKQVRTRTSKRAHDPKSLEAATLGARRNPGRRFSS